MSSRRVSHILTGHVTIWSHRDSLCGVIWYSKMFTHVSVSPELHSGHFKVRMRFGKHTLDSHVHYLVPILFILVAVTLMMG